jgi:hypothetical protein
VKTCDGSDTELTLLTVPFTCEPLSMQPIFLCQEINKHLSSLDWMGAYLLKLTYYWQQLTGRGENGPIAVLTHWQYLLLLPTLYKWMLNPLKFYKISMLSHPLTLTNLHAKYEPSLDQPCCSEYLIAYPVWISQQGSSAD